jgi:hypothetical protein
MYVAFHPLPWPEARVSHSVCGNESSLGFKVRGLSLAPKKQLQTMEDETHHAVLLEGDQASSGKTRH